MRIIAVIASLLLCSACGSGSYIDASLAESWYAEQPGGKVMPDTPSGLSTQPAWKSSFDALPAGGRLLRRQNYLLLPGIAGVIDILDLRSGRRYGRLNFSGYLHSTPAVGRDRILAVSHARDILLQCIGLDDARLRWAATVEPTDGAVCLAGDRALIVTNSGNVMCFDIADSIPLWSRRLPGRFRVGPLAVDTLIVLLGESGDITALSLIDGEPRWRYATGAAFVAPAVTDGRCIYAVNRSGRLTAVNVAGGELLYEVELGDRMHVAPVLHAETLLLALAGGDLLWLAADDGKELRRVATGRLPAAPPVILERDVLLTSRNGRLLRVSSDADKAVELLRLRRRMTAPPLLSHDGVVLIDEEGELSMYPWVAKRGSDDVEQ
jgi:hypothetical protein